MDTDSDPNGPEPITDHLGRLVWAVDADLQDEPEPGSVALTGGDWGTAWQRNFHDGLWHSTRKRGGAKTWEWLLTRRNLRLVYDAEVRFDTEPGVDTQTDTRLTAADLENAL